MHTQSIAVTGNFAGRCQASSPTQGSFLPGRTAQGPSSGSYTAAARGSDLIGPETPRQSEDLRDKAGIGSGRPRQPEVTAAKDRTSISLFHPITGNTQRVARMMPNVTAQNTAQSTSVRPNFSTFSRVRPAPPR